MRLKDAKEYGKQNFLKCPNCKSKNIIITQVHAACMECGKKKKLELTLD